MRKGTDYFPFHVFFGRPLLLVLKVKKNNPITNPNADLTPFLTLN